MWITDTSYRNKRIISVRSRNHPVNIGPTMFHFSKDDETFRRFCAEILSSNPNLITLKKLGVDMEAAIFNGFESMIPRLTKLYCVKHLKDRDVQAIDRLHGKSKIEDKFKLQYKAEILWDIYGKRSGPTFEKGMAEAVDTDQLNALLLQLKPRWDKLCPGFHQ